MTVLIEDVGDFIMGLLIDEEQCDRELSCAFKLKGSIWWGSVRTDNGRNGEVIDAIP